MFDQIEKLKHDLTDQYVVVVADVPELQRFGGHVGQVKTVNMNGRALVQFDAWNNIGWYDIGVDYLKVVPKPDKTAEGKKEEPKREAAPKPAPKPAAAGEKKLSPLEMARLQGAAKVGAAAPAAKKAAPAAGTAKKSTVDILAAARAAKAAPAAGVETPAAAPKAKLNTADILAAARAKQSTESPAPVAHQEETASAPTPAAVAPKPVAVAASKPAAAKPPALATGGRPSVSEILAWCRQHDTK